MSLSRLEPMAAGVWQVCVRRLTTEIDTSRHYAAKLLKEWSFSTSGRTFSRSGGELRGRTRVAGSGERWIRLYNVGAGGRSSCGKDFRLEEWKGVKNCGSLIVPRFCRRSVGKYMNAMELSTVSTGEEATGESGSAEDLLPANDVENSSGDEEFVPGEVDTPSTPLVQAIRDSQEDGASDAPVSSSLEGASRDTEGSDRVIQPDRVFVGGLPFSVRGDDMRKALHTLLEKYGTVKLVQLSKHRNQSQSSVFAGKHRGFAFVEMSSPEEAQAVIDNLNGKTIWDRRITVSFGLKRVEPDPSNLRRFGGAARVARCKVFVGNLHEDTSVEALEDRFSHYGPITASKIISDLASGRSRGFGFITFEEEAQAMKAILDLDGSILDGSVIRVNMAKYPQSV